VLHDVPCVLRSVVYWYTDFLSFVLIAITVPTVVDWYPRFFNYCRPTGLRLESHYLTWLASYMRPSWNRRPSSRL
jgi:hypothetical protein